MITKERLLELIEQGKTIYSSDTKLYGLAKWLELENRLEKLEFNEDGEVKLFIIDNGWWHWFSLRDLFETKEEAEWHREFGCIERTEKLELPTWEEIEKDFDKINKFGTYAVIDTYGLYMDIFVDNYCNKFIVLTTLPRMPLTKENYIKACRKCKELFLGGEDE